MQLLFDILGNVHNARIVGVRWILLCPSFHCAGMSVRVRFAKSLWCQMFLESNGQNDSTRKPVHTIYCDLPVVTGGSNP
jgi:hypothetical protein